LHVDMRLNGSINHYSNFDLSRRLLLDSVPADHYTVKARSFELNTCMLDKN